MYKYDLGHILLNRVVNYHYFVKCSCTESVTERERERERGCCLHLVTAAACGEEEDKRSLPLCLLDIVFLSYSVFYSLGVVVVFPTIVGFPRYILCLNIAFCFLRSFRAYIHVSVVAERTSE